MENNKKLNNKKEQMEKIIVVLLKNYKKTSFVYHGSRRVMIYRETLGYHCIKAFYHFNFIEFSVSTSFWSNKTWIHSEINF